VQSLRDRLAADGEKYLIARVSDYGWKLVSSMEGLDGKMGRISMTQLRFQEKAFLAHQQAVDSVKPSVCGAGLGPSSRLRARLPLRAKRRGKGLPKAHSRVGTPPSSFSEKCKTIFDWGRSFHVFGELFSTMDFYGPCFCP
jgi:hypothetical protein